MKPLLYTLLSVVIISASGCSKDPIAAGTPGCIKKMILDNKDKPGWIIGQVNEYSFQGKLVYAFEPDYRVIADASTNIVSSDCNSICYVGGFGGPDVVLCNGVNFSQNAVLVRVIWKKN